MFDTKYNLVRKILILAILLCSSCIETGTGTGGNPLGSFFNDPSGSAASPESDGLSSTELEDSSAPDAADTGADIQASLPGVEIPLEEVNTEYLLISVPDANDVATIQATKLKASSWLKVTNTSAENRETAARKRNPLKFILMDAVAQLQLQLHQWLGFYDAHADENLTPENSEPCQKSFTRCFAIDSTGTLLPAPLPDSDYQDEYDLTYIDPMTLKESIPVKEGNFTPFIYLDQAAASPKAMTRSATNSIFQISPEGKIAKVNYLNGVYRVNSGAFEDAYQFALFPPQLGGKINGFSFNPNAKSLSIMEEGLISVIPTERVEIDGSAIGDISGEVTFNTQDLCPTGCSPNIIRNRGLYTLFSSEFEIPVDKGILNEVLIDANRETIKLTFFDNRYNFKPDGSIMYFKKTLAFDAYPLSSPDSDFPELVALVIFEDEHGNPYLGMNINTNELGAAKMIHLPDSFKSVREILVYRHQQDDSKSGHAMIMNNKELQFVVFDIFRTEVDDKMLRYSPEDRIPLSNDPIQALFDDVHRRIFVLNKAKGTPEDPHDLIYVVDVKDEKNPKLAAEHLPKMIDPNQDGIISMGDILPNKKFPFFANAMTFVVDKEKTVLFVSSENMRGTLPIVIPKTEITGENTSESTNPSEHLGPQAEDQVIINEPRRIH